VTLSQIPIIERTMTTEPEAIPAPAPLRQRQRALVREAIVTAAYELFDRRPYPDVTVADIADAAVVSRATFFRHFADKQEVVFARQPDIRDTVSARELDRPCPEPATLRTALLQLRDIVVDVYREARDSPWHLTHERLIDDNPELHDRHVRKLLQFGDDMAALLEHRGAKRNVAVVAAHTAVACCLAARTLRSTDTSMADAVAECFDQFLAPDARPSSI
jgi:AcrR family transcriptional regulator